MERLRDLVEPSDLKQLLADRYTGAEIVERLDLSCEEVLDFCLDHIYDNPEAFYEVLQDLNYDTEEEAIQET